MELTVGALNKLKTMGERVKVEGQPITILRVPGGYIYEYYHNVDTGNIKAAVFISTDELARE